MREAAFGLLLRLLFQLITTLWHFARNFVLFCFVSTSCSIALLFCCCFSGLLQSRCPVDYIQRFERATYLAEWGVLLPLPSGAHVLVADFSLFVVLKRSRCDYNKLYWDYHRSCDVDWEDKASVRWFLYICWSADVLDISALYIRIGKRTASAMEVRKWVGLSSVLFKSGHRSTLVESAHTVRSVIEAFPYFLDPASNAPIIEDELIDV